MIRLTVLAVGKLSQAWMREGCAEYAKRMARWCSLDIIEIDECRLPENPSPAQIAQGLQKEGEAMLAKLPKGAVPVALCIEGKTRSSEALAAFLEEKAAAGDGHIVFFIGGSHGLSDAVKQAAQLRFSMSPMTFPHQLARVMLLEQLYRALSINHHAKYHK